MRFLFTTNPGVGHLFPMLPVAQAAQAAGHAVAFATSRSFCPAVAARGFESLPAGLDWLESNPSQTFPEFERMSPEQQGEWLMTDVFADIAAHQMVPDLLDICAGWRPDVIVGNDFTFAVCVAAERLGLPHATISVSFFLSAATLEPMIGDQLAYLRSMHGLPPYPATDMLYPYLYLAYAPPSFQPREVHVMHRVRPAPVPHPADTVLPAWWDDLPDRPTVYASMSSVYRGLSVFPDLIAGLRDEPINLILTVGNGQDPAQFGPQPPNVYIERFIPQAALLPRCDLFITHNPLFTMMSALGCGVPLLMIPLGGELRLGAMRAVELGLGRAIKLPGQASVFFDQWVPELSPSTAKAAVRELLSTPRYRANARRMRDEIGALPGPEHAVELLARLGAERAPIL